MEYLGLPGCIRLTDGRVELVCATAVGPRVLRLGLVGGPNLFGEHPQARLETAAGVFKPYGGHRLWAAPERMPQSYEPDSTPVQAEAAPGRALLRATGPSGLEKTVEVSLEEGGALVRHRLMNRTAAAVEAAPWALSIMAPGGLAVVPHEPFKTWEQDQQPARALVLWSYTDLSDPRWLFARRFLGLRCDPARASPQKFGAGNRAGWAAYWSGELVFIKRFAHLPGARYPDMGCSTEVYCAGSFLELETLAPLSALAPGAFAEHWERWRVFEAGPAPDDAEELAGRLERLAAATPAVSGGA